MLQQENKGLKAKKSLLSFCRVAKGELGDPASLARIRQLISEKAKAPAVDDAVSETTFNSANTYTSCPKLSLIFF